MGLRVLVISSRYYEKISVELEAGATEVLEAAGCDITLKEVFGAFEIPAAVAMAADSDMFDAYVTIGCVIRGETTHYDYVCGESARGLMDLSVQRRLPIGYGILTVENEGQAWVRADRKQKNKGADAARAALSMYQFRKDLLRG